MGKPRKKWEIAEEEALAAEKRHRKKMMIAKVALLTLTVIVGAVVVVNSLGTKTPNHRLLLPTPNHYTTGVVVDNLSMTFVFEWEYNFNFTPGAHVMLQILLTGGVGVQATFGTTAQLNSYTGPFPFQSVLKPSAPWQTWSGVVPAGGGYRLELGNLGSESQVATTQTYVSAS